MIDSLRAHADDIRMSHVTDFITELIRAANEVGKLDNYQRRRLLDRAVATIRDGRDMVGIPSSRTTADKVIDFQTMAAAIEKHSDDAVKAELLEAADMIRTLKIVLDAKGEVLRGD